MPSHGQRNLLISRLQKHVAASTQTVENNPTTSVQPDDTRSCLLTEDQLAQIQSLVTRSVEESVAEIASNAARAAVEAISNSPPQRNTNNSSNAVIASRDEIEVGTTDTAMTQTSNVVSLNDQLGQSVPYGNNCHEVPASYIKKIQAGEFFYLSKLLPKDISVNNQPDDAIVLTLGNSTIKAKKASQLTTRITNIEQWTTAFTIYMSVMTHQYPTRAQELLQYMSLIRSPCSSYPPGLGMVHV